MNFLSMDIPSLNVVVDRYIIDLHNFRQLYLLEFTSTYHLDIGEECVTASQFRCTSKSVERLKGKIINI